MSDGVPADRKNVAFMNSGTGGDSLTPASSGSVRQKWISRADRHRANLNEAHIESRASRHAQIIRRPRARGFSHVPSASGEEASGDQGVLLTSISHSSKGSGGDREERSTDNIPKQLGRLSLFVDLVWVGIIANLSATFSKQAFTDSGVNIGLAVLEFILLFLPIWRVWNYLRAYNNDYFNDDIVQRNFIVWILLLAVLYGINAPYAFVPDNGGGTSLHLLIGIYLTTRASFLVSQGIQSIFLPFLRRLFLFKLAATIVPGAFWIAAMYTPYPGKIALLISANAVEHPVDFYLASPRGDRLLPDGWKKTPDIDHCVERYEGFFIIILGEGVFRLIEGSPSGLGFNPATGVVLTALLMYYILHWIYFNGDQSKEFVHALRRTWWKPVLWTFLHVMLFGALLITAASVLFLVDHVAEVTTSSTGDASLEPQFLRYALWTASAALSIVILTMTCLTLLNRPLDPPKTLLVNSRLLRMAPRALVIVVICCLPLPPNMAAASWIGAATCTLYAEFLWEWIAGLEKNWRFLEPKDEEQTL